jgi:SSS family solute:Na+ symporter
MPRTGLPGVDIAVLLVYLAGVVLFGSWFVRTSRSTDRFMVAGRRLPGWAVGLSLFGTYLSSISFLALPGKAYAANWGFFVFSLSLPFAAWVATRYFVPLYRKRNEVSAYGYLEHRFGPWARTYATIFYLLTQLGRMGTIMFLVALALSPLLGWPVPTIIILIGLLVTLYAVLGGIEAVIWTDVIQSIVLLGGALAAVIFIFWDMPAGPMELFKVGAQYNKFSLGSFGPSLAESTFWVVLVYGIFINLQNYGIDQNYIQRYIAAKSDKEASKSVWLSALLYLPASAMFFFIGTGLFVFYKLQPALLPAGLQAPEMADRVFPFFIVNVLPVGLTGLVIAAILAAAMSTISTSVNSSATVILSDIYKRYFRKDAGEEESMRTLHVTTIVWGLAGTGVGLAMMNVRQALDAWWKWAAVFSGGMLGLFLLAAFSRRARNVPAIIGAVIGILIILWITVSQRVNTFLSIVFGTSAIFLVGWLLSQFARGGPSPAAEPADTAEHAEGRGEGSAS